MLKHRPMLKDRLLRRLRVGRLPRLSESPILRVLALLTVFTTCLLFFFLHLARARTGEVLSMIGERVMQIPDGEYGNAARLFSVNGLPIGFQTGFSRKPYATVVAEFTDACRAGGGMQGGDLRPKGELAAARESVRPQLQDQGLLNGVFELQTPRGRVIACVDTRGTPWFSHAMLDRLKQFSRTYNLGDLGILRYAQVKRTPYGAHFLTMWTGEQAPLRGMFPREGDAPGRDHQVVPRPKGARRLMSVGTQRIQMLTFESANADVDEVADDYERVFTASGFAFERLPDGEHQRYFRVKKEDIDSFVTLAESKHGVLTTIVDMPP